MISFETKDKMISILMNKTIIISERHGNNWTEMNRVWGDLEISFSFRYHLIIITSNSQLLGLHICCQTKQQIIKKKKKNYSNNININFNLNLLKKCYFSSETQIKTIFFWQLVLKIKTYFVFDDQNQRQRNSPRVST